MSATDPIRSKLGHFLFLDGLPAKPSTYWIALFLQYDIPDVSGLGGLEVTRVFLGIPTGYARVAYPPGGARFTESPSVPGLFYNLQTVQFPAPALAWSAVTSFALMDSELDGLALATGHLAVPLFVAQGGQAPVFEPGALVFNVV